MKKTDPIEQALNAIGDLRSKNDPKEAAVQLRGFLRDRSNLVIAKAAKVVGELRLSLVPELTAAFDRMMTNPQKLDKRCAAITEIITALYELDYTEPEVYRRGIRHVQKEASFGPPVDTATKLRGICAQGLLRTHSADAMSLVVDLLADPEPAARLGAIRALALNGGEAGALLLRFKALVGDEDLEVTAEGFSALMSCAPEQTLSFVARYMDSEDEAITEAAIWALGQSRRPAAVEALKDKWERTVDRSARKALVGALAASRLQEAIDFLGSQLQSTDLATAGEILGALSNYGSNEAVRQSVTSAVEERGDRGLTALFHQYFPLK
jgi:hypothetical protein